MRMKRMPNILAEIGNVLSTRVRYGMSEKG